MADLREVLAAELDQFPTPALSVAWQSASDAGAFALGVDGDDVRFQAASISKVVTAEIMLSLVADGELGLDDDAFELLEEHRPRVGRSWAPRVTPRMLLAHRAGLIDDSGFPGYPAGTELPSLESILRGGPGVNSAPLQVGVIPGMQFRYSGVGYVVLQLLIERLTGLSFSEAAYDRVLGPAGMVNATFAQPPPPRDDRFAIGHVQDVPIDGGWHVYPELAAAGMWCTATDLVRLHRRVTERPVEWLRSEGPTPGGEFGLGIEIGRTTVGHSGGNLGFVSRVVGSPDGAYSIGVMANGDDGRLVLRACAHLAEHLAWDAIPMPEENEATREDLVTGILGVYEGEGHRAEIGLHATFGLTIVVDGHPPMPLSFVPPDLTAPGMALTIRVGADDGTVALTLRQPGHQLRLMRSA